MKPCRCVPRASQALDFAEWEAPGACFAPLGRRQRLQAASGKRNARSSGAEGRRVWGPRSGPSAKEGEGWPISEKYANNLFLIIIQKPLSFKKFMLYSIYVFTKGNGKVLVERLGDPVVNPLNVLSLKAPLSCFLLFMYAAASPKYTNLPPLGSTQRRSGSPVYFGLGPLSEVERSPHRALAQGRTPSDCCQWASTGRASALPACLRQAQLFLSIFQRRGFEGQS